MQPDPFRDAGTPEYDLLASALRRFLDVAIDARALDASSLHETALALDGVSERLEAARAALPAARRFTPFDGQRVPMPVWEYEAGDDGLIARGAFSNGHTGPPGTVHGGWVAFAFDEVFGWANVHAGYASMTGKLTVRYRKPTPVGVPVLFTVPRPRALGKRVHVHGTLTAKGVVTAEAEGLFVVVRRRPSPSQ